MFVFSLSMQRPERQGSMRSPARGDRKGAANRKDSGGRLENITTTLLDKKLETSGFCREGYMVLERYTGEGKSRIRGECRESATDADREQFSGVILKPVKYSS